MTTVAMLLLAAGRGTRFGGEVPKVYLPLGDHPVLLHSAERLAAIGEATHRCELIAVVAADDEHTHLAPWLPRLRALGARIVHGGATRQESMRRGLAAAGHVDLVLVHDAARPCFPIAAARECLRRATDCGAALLAIPAADTLKRVDARGRVTATIDRGDVWYAQTPQVVRRDLLERALAAAAAAGTEATDDVGLVQAIGGEVAVVPGSPGNLKITRREDLALAAAVLAAEAASAPKGP